MVVLSYDINLKIISNNKYITVKLIVLNYLEKNIK